MRQFFGAFRSGVPRAYLVRIARQTPLNALVSLAIVVLVVSFLYGQVPTEWLVTWAGLEIVLLLFVLIRWHLGQRQHSEMAESSDHRTSVRGLRHSALWAGLSGGVWGALAFFLPIVPSFHQMVLILVIGGMTAGGASTLAAVRQVAFIYILSVTSPLILYYLLAGDGAHIVMGLMFLTFTIAMLGTANLVHSSLKDQLEAEVGRARAVNEIQALLGEFENSRQEWLASAEAAEPFALFDQDGALLLWNDRFRDTLMIPSHVLVRGNTRDEIIAHATVPKDLPPDSQEASDWREALLSLHESADPTMVVQLSNGRWVNILSKRTSSGQIVMIFADVTDQKETELSLRFSEARLKSAQRVAGLGTWVRNIKTGELTWSDELYDLLELKKGEIEPSRERFEDFIHPEDREALNEAVRRGLEEYKADDIEFRLFTAHGEMLFVRARGEIIFDKDGEPSLAVATMYDITDLRRAQADLAQAQKMEAVGQLTGGISHDFNNLLLVVLGNLELAIEKVGSTERLDRKRLLSLLQRANEAAERGSALTKRLLAFARRQDLRPEKIGVNELARNMAGLIGRAAGESVDVRFELGDTVGFVEADRSQLEAAILNLVINSRDAMSQGGEVTITTGIASEDGMLSAASAVGPGELADKPGMEGDAAPSQLTGRVIEIVVADTGCGIEPEHLERVFEPFFTTKDVDKGSGLGLSMVFGFARQSGGDVSISSGENRGTVVRIRLPEVRAPEEPSSDTVVAGEARGGAGRKVLVIEDSGALRNLITELLSDLDYEVTAVADGPTALALVEDGAEFDLLFTDVVLPKGLNGYQIATEIRKLRPDAKVLYTSGYADLAVVDDLIAEGANLLKKPYRRKELAAAIEQVLS